MEGKAGSETYIMDHFWHKNLDRIPHITGSFIEDFTSANLPIKATQARGYRRRFSLLQIISRLFSRIRALILVMP